MNGLTEIGVMLIFLLLVIFRFAIELHEVFHALFCEKINKKVKAQVLA